MGGELKLADGKVVSGPVASGDNSIAMGTGTTAEGEASTAMGCQTLASGSCSTAMGSDTRVGLLKEITDALSSIKTVSTGLKTHCTEYTDLLVGDALTVWQTTFQSLEQEYNAAEIKLTAMKTLCADAKPKFSNAEVLKLFTNISSLEHTIPETPSNPEDANAVATALGTFIAECTTADDLTKPATVIELLSGE